MSISQDIITLCYKSRERMLKQVGLDICPKKQFKIKGINYVYLYNLGHYICYHEVLKTEATWISDILERGNGFAALPLNLSKFFLTQATSDNEVYGQEHTPQNVTNTVLDEYGNFGSIEHSSCE